MDKLNIQRTFQSIIFEYIKKSMNKYNTCFNTLATQWAFYFKLQNDLIPIYERH